jgi:flagellar assembly factor FliW
VIDLALAGARTTADADVVFPSGLPGFADAHRFRVRAWTATPEPFALLVSIDRPDVTFAIVPAALLDTAPLDLEDALCAHPTLQRVSDAVVRCIVTPGGRGREPTVNLLAPIVVDRVTGAACQLALDGPCHATRARLALRG